MDKVGIVVDDLGGTIASFREFRFEVEGRPRSKENGLDVLLGLGNQRVEIPMMSIPDGHSRLELSRFSRRLSSQINRTLRSTP